MNDRDFKIVKKSFLDGLDLTILFGVVDSVYNVMTDERIQEVNTMWDYFNLYTCLTAGCLFFRVALTK